MFQIIFVFATKLFMTLVNDNVNTQVRIMNICRTEIIYKTPLVRSPEPTFRG